MTDVLLITGANSYVAGHMIKLALDRGYKVIGTVRSKTSGEKLLAMFPKPAAAKQLVYYIVEDIKLADNYKGAFTALEDRVTGVVHTASPFTLVVEDNTRDLLEPAREGAIAILEAATRFGGGAVRSVISISSFAAVVDIPKGMREGYVYSEADWNPISWTEAQGTDSAVVAYCASKALSEKAQWEWREQHKNDKDSSFALTTITPPWIFGPYVDPAAMGIHSAAQLNESMKLIARLIDGSIGEEGAVPPTDFAGFIDVRDLAIITLAAYERASDPAVANQRFLAGSKFSYQTAADVIRDSFPELRSKVPKGTPGAGRTEATYSLDTSKVRSTFQIKFTTIDDCIRDSIHQIKSLS